MLSCYPLNDIVRDETGWSCQKLMINPRNDNFKIHIMGHVSPPRTGRVKCAGRAAFAAASLEQQKHAGRTAFPAAALQGRRSEGAARVAGARRVRRSRRPCNRRAAAGPSDRQSEGAACAVGARRARRALPPLPLRGERGSRPRCRSEESTPVALSVAAVTPPGRWN